MINLKENKWYWRLYKEVLVLCISGLMIFGYIYNIQAAKNLFNFWMFLVAFISVLLIFYCSSETFKNKIKKERYKKNIFFIEVEIIKLFNVIILAALGYFFYACLYLLIIFGKIYENRIIEQEENKKNE